MGLTEQGKNMTETFPLVDVSGSPYERGVSHGRQVPERVARSIALYWAQLARRGVDDRRIRLLAQRMSHVIAAYDADYLEEMRGITDGAGVSLECAPDEIFWLAPVDGFVVHANHWCLSGRAWPTA